MRRPLDDGVDQAPLPGLLGAHEEVALEAVTDSPFLLAATKKILEVLSDPSSAAAMAMAKEHVAKLTLNRTLMARGRASVYLLYCEYALRDPKSQVAETFTQTGTGFVVSADGKLLTAKRVIQPWKFDRQVALLRAREHLELDEKSYKLWAWPVDASVLSPAGQLDPQGAFMTDKQTLKVLKVPEDRMHEEEFHDPESGYSGPVTLHVSGEDDAAVLQLVGGKFQTLPLAQTGGNANPGTETVLLGFPYGMSQAKAMPQLVSVKVTKTGNLLSLDHQISPGESGAPLLSEDGGVVALAGEGNQATPIQAYLNLLQ